MNNLSFTFDTLHAQSQLNAYVATYQIMMLVLKRFCIDNGKDLNEDSKVIALSSWCQAA